MYIVSMSGEVLLELDRWDVRSVARAEAWIKDHGYFIWKMELTIMGTYVVTVRS